MFLIERYRQFELYKLYSFIILLLVFIQNSDVGSESFISSISLNGLIHMAEYEGFCLKCKTYGPIKDVKHYSMANGRKRVGGTCSQSGCTGKISKIVG